MINKQALEAVGVTLKEYEEWCRNYKKPQTSANTKEEFFKKIKRGEIVRNSTLGLLIDLVEETTNNK